MKYNNKNNKWIGFIVFGIIVIAMYYSLGLRLILEHGIELLSFSAVGLIVYYLFSDVIFQKSKKGTKKTLKCLATTTIVLVIFISCYFIINKRPDVVQMQEDVIYVAPRQDTVRTKLNNIKEDTVGKVQMKEEVIYKLPKKK
jgi:predicted PurR-regulated permease PerM